MKIVILSDIHDNETNLNKCLKWCKENNVEQIICLGDVTNSQSLKKLASFSGSIHLVKGNAEIYNSEEVKVYENIVFYGRVGVFELEGIVIGLCHEPFLFERLLRRGVSIIFYGHTHKPWIEEKNKVKFVNPGTLNGMFARSTFAYWDTEKKELQLKGLDEL